MSQVSSSLRVFVDANVLLDVVLHRTRYVKDSLLLLQLGFQDRVTLVTTASTFHAVRFVAFKSRGRGAMEVLEALLRQFAFIPETVDSVRAGLSYKDPEDAALAFACLEAGVNLVATRDVAGFAPFQDRGLRPMLPAVLAARLSQ
jgi:predicted nucleic acid-binding protein